ncbi:hypothetical protein [Nocardia wallacei]|uniref:hypothetical protein n=1 Tax=Nocardia wallacei TaxID=480035 RepID=UPI0024565E6D|nr:hypothetical protein [Nocardia wallacei]
MPYWLPPWAESHLRGVTPEEVDQVLTARRRWPRPSTGGPVRVTLIAGRTLAGRPVVVAVREVAPFESIVVAAAELAGEDLAAFEEWEVTADEPYEG